MTDDDARYLRRAIELSRAAGAAGDMPFGAVGVIDGRISAEAVNHQSTQADCTAHAEMVLVRRAQAQGGVDALRGATVYASGEPCAMCAGALFWAGVRRVVYAASQPEMARVMGGALLPAGARSILTAAQPAVQVDGPWLEAEALEVIAQAVRAARP